MIERVLIENEIPLEQTHQNKDGDLVLTCESKAVRDELKDLVQMANEQVEMRTPNAKHKPITIVGLPTKYSKEDTMKHIVSQNSFIKKFATLNNMDDHLQLHVIKPLKNKPHVFQAFASASSVLRDGLNHHNNRLVIGLSSCRIYDRQTIVRCNNCQHFGHFVKNCPTPDQPFCGKCSGRHRTDGCTQENKKCINCVRSNVADKNHSVFYHACPSNIRHLEQKEAS